MATGAATGAYRVADGAHDAARTALFKQVTATCSGLVGRVALSFEADPALRHELVQDIMLAIWLALPTWRGDSSLKTFVASIAQKRALSHVTRRVREPRQVELPTDLTSLALTPDEEALRNDQRKQLVGAIQRLPIPQREAIVLSFEGFGYAEVAQVLGISVNAATLRCQRAKAALRELLERPA